MNLAELRIQLTDEVLHRAEARSWPRLYLSALNRRGYVAGQDAWRALCPALTLGDLRHMNALLLAPPPPPERHKAAARRYDGMTIKTGEWAL